LTFDFDIDCFCQPTETANSAFCKGDTRLGL